MRFTKTARYGVPVRPDWVSAKNFSSARARRCRRSTCSNCGTSYVTTAAEQGVRSRVERIAQAQVEGAIRSAREGVA
jgi:hypothetical protein